MRTAATPPGRFSSDIARWGATAGRSRRAARTSRQGTSVGSGAGRRRGPAGAGRRGVRLDRRPAYGEAATHRAGAGQGTGAAGPCAGPAACGTGSGLARPGGAGRPACRPARPASRRIDSGWAAFAAAGAPGRPSGARPGRRPPGFRPPDARQRSASPVGPPAGPPGPRREPSTPPAARPPPHRPGRCTPAARPLHPRGRRTPAARPPRRCGERVGRPPPSNAHARVRVSARVRRRSALPTGSVPGTRPVPTPSSVAPGRAGPRPPAPVGRRSRGPVLRDPRSPVPVGRRSRASVPRGLRSPVTVLVRPRSPVPVGQRFPPARPLPSGGPVPVPRRPPPGPPAGRRTVVRPGRRARSGWCPATVRAARYPTVPPCGTVGPCPTTGRPVAAPGRSQHRAAPTPAAPVRSGASDRRAPRRDGQPGRPRSGPGAAGGRATRRPRRWPPCRRDRLRSPGDGWSPRRGASRPRTR